VIKETNSKQCKYDAPSIKGNSNAKMVSLFGPACTHSIVLSFKIKTAERMTVNTVTERSASRLLDVST